MLWMPAHGPSSDRATPARPRRALEREAERRWQSLDDSLFSLLAERLGLTEPTERIGHGDRDEPVAPQRRPPAIRPDEAARARDRLDARLWS